MAVYVLWAAVCAILGSMLDIAMRGWGVKYTGLAFVFTFMALSETFDRKFAQDPDDSTARTRRRWTLIAAVILIAYRGIVRT